MFKRRKVLPDGQKREDLKSAEIDMMDKWYEQEATWAEGYMRQLERHLADLKKRCEKCPYRDQEGSGCHEEITD